MGSGNVEHSVKKNKGYKPNMNHALGQINHTSDDWWIMPLTRNTLLDYNLTSTCSDLELAP